MQVAYVYAFGIDSTTIPQALLPLVHRERLPDLSRAKGPDNDFESSQHWSPDYLWIGDEDELLLTNHDISKAG